MEKVGLKKYDTGLVIGRFQPFHKGHGYLIRKSFNYCSHLIIGIGSSTTVDLANPYNLEKREEMLNAFITHEKLKDKILKIISIPDIPDDDKWLRTAVRKVGKFDVIIGNNNWVNGIFKKVGYKIITIPYFYRLKYQGYIVRQLMRQGKKWKDRVPSYLVKLLG